MPSIVNLNRFRKAKKAAEAERRAAENRAAFGRSKAEQGSIRGIDDGVDGEPGNVVSGKVDPRTLLRVDVHDAMSGERLPTQSGCIIADAFAFGNRSARTAGDQRADHRGRRSAPHAAGNARPIGGSVTAEFTWMPMDQNRGRPHADDCRCYPLPARAVNAKPPNANAVWMRPAPLSSARRSG